MVPDKVDRGRATAFLLLLSGQVIQHLRESNLDFTQKLNLIFRFGKGFLFPLPCFMQTVKYFKKKKNPSKSQLYFLFVRKELFFYFNEWTSSLQFQCDAKWYLHETLPRHILQVCHLKNKTYNNKSEIIVQFENTKKINRQLKHVSWCLQSVQWLALKKDILNI